MPVGLGTNFGDLGYLPLTGGGANPPAESDLLLWGDQTGIVQLWGDQTGNVLLWGDEG